MSIENLVSSIKDDIIIIPEICYFKIDPLIRRAKSLQESVNYKQTDTLKCNSNTYKKIKDLKIIDLENTFDVIIENNISDNCVSMHNNCNLYEKVLPYSALSNITNKY